ncbi:MAG: hypothetical protein ACK4NN_05840 [Rheinheimera sp.]
MQLLTVFLIVALTVIAATLVIISLKLTDLVTEAKACRIAVQNIEADDLFQQGHFSEHQRKAFHQHNAEILGLLQRIEVQLNPKLKTERSANNVLVQAEPAVTETQNRFGNSRF